MHVGHRVTLRLEPSTEPHRLIAHAENRRAGKVTGRQRQIPLRAGADNLEIGQLGAPLVKPASQHLVARKAGERHLKKGPCRRPHRYWVKGIGPVASNDQLIHPKGIA